MKFIGRRHELALLDKLYQRQGAQFLVLYGRRRIGKTALIQEWISSRVDSQISPDDILYWMATQTSTTNQLREFSQTVLLHMSPNTPVSATFSYDSWETALAQVAEYAARRRFVLILDEFTYVMQANTEVPSLIQRLWDHQLKTSNLFLILTGSLAGIIQRTILEYQAPLYGRATSKLKLQPLSFGTLSLFFPNMPTEQRVAVYAITGGIPAYLELFDDNLNLLNNLREHFITPTNLMLNDAVFLLREQLDEPRNYMALLESIAAGNHKLADVAKMAGLDRSAATKYLAVLSELGYVKRTVPATVRHPEKSRQGRFVITDAYLRFYFRFLRPYLGDIERGRINRVISLLRDHLTDFIGTHTFEELCREWLDISTDEGTLPFFPDRVGSHWSRTSQVDVLGINWRTKEILLGECKWGRQSVERKVVDTLVDKTAKVLPSKDAWTVYYAFFVRTPLTSDARTRAQTIGAMVVDVEQIERDMLAWVESQ
ncbi:MAG: ATP-binding protein [Chloroflexota bacterium]